ncbi:MAG: hypothetical protein KY469_22405 [Actinobacteria bacterium]|nr:hypothetical protein [Actinomycetota bacterium]
MDTTGGDAPLSISLQMTDDVSGVKDGFIRFESPSGNQAEGTTVPTLTSGDKYSGTWSVDILFSEYAESGDWTVTTSEPPTSQATPATTPPANCPR